MQRFIYLMLGLGMSISGISCIHYDYAIGVINDGPTTLIGYPFEIYPDDIPLADAGIINGTIDDYTKKPDKYLDIYWMEDETPPKKTLSGIYPHEFEQIYWGDKSPGRYNKFHARLDMTLPKQFTSRTGTDIDFRFYKGNVLVIYEYKCPEYSDPNWQWKRDTRQILSDGTPYEGGDFKNYMDQNPGATTEDFMKHQREKYGIQSP